MPSFLCTKKGKNAYTDFMVKSMIKIENLYALEHTLASTFLRQTAYPWLALPKIKEWICVLGTTLKKEEFEEISPKVWVHKRAKISDTAYLGAPCIIGESTEVRHGAFIRGSALVGENCVVGNSVELKNVILFDGVQVPHYNYVGDSILGFKAHMGAGSITSNVKSDKTFVAIKSGEEKISTELKKVGAFLGDFVEIGCNSVLNPGTIIGRNTQIYPLSSVRGVIPPNSIYKNSIEMITKR